MRILIAIVLLIVSALCIVGYTQSDLNPNNRGIRSGFLVAAMITSAAGWVLFRSARRNK